MAKESLFVKNQSSVRDILNAMKALVVENNNGINLVEIDTVNHYFIKKSDEDKYLKLKDLLSIVSKEVETDDIVIYNGVFVSSSDRDRFITLLDSGLGIGRTSRDNRSPELIIPGTDIVAPRDKNPDESMLDYEKFLKVYYDRNGVHSIYDENGKRSPYPHECYKKVDGHFVTNEVLSHDDSFEFAGSTFPYVNNYYRQYFASDLRFNPFMRNGAQPQQGQQGPQQGQGQQGQGQQGPQQGPQQGQGQQGPQQGQGHQGRRRATGGPQHGTRSRRFLPFDWFHNFNTTAVSDESVSKYNKILKTVGLIAAGGVVCYGASKLILGAFGGIAKGVALGGAPVIFGGIAEVALIVGGIALLKKAYKNYMARKAAEARENTEDPNQPTNTQTQEPNRRRRHGMGRTDGRSQSQPQQNQQQVQGAQAQTQQQTQGAQAQTQQQTQDNQQRPGFGQRVRQTAQDAFNRARQRNNGTANTQPTAEEFNSLRQQLEDMRRLLEQMQQAQQQTQQQTQGGPTL